jgi:hypothetical protein
MANTGTTITINTQVNAQALQQLISTLGNLNGKINIVNRNFNQTNATMGQLAGGVFTGNLAFAALRATLHQIEGAFSSALGEMQKMIKASEDQENAIQKLTTALVASGTNSDAYKNKLILLGESIQRNTKFSDDQAQSALAVLARFRVMPSTIEPVIKATADLAETQKVDLTVAARAVGAAIQGSTTQFQRLTRAHVEGNTVAQRTTSILGILAALMKNAATDAAATFEGRITQLGNAYEEVREKFGDAITLNPAILDVLASIKDKLFGLSDTARDFREQMQLAIADALIKLLALIPDLTAKVAQIGLTVLSVIEVVYNFGKALYYARDALLELGALLAIIAVTISLANPVTAATGALVTLGATIRGLLPTFAKWLIGLGLVGKAVEFFKTKSQEASPEIDKLRQGAEGLTRGLSKAALAGQAEILDAKKLNRVAAAFQEGRASADDLTHAYDRFARGNVDVAIATGRVTRETVNLARAHEGLKPLVEKNSKGNVDFAKTGGDAAKEIENARKETQQEIEVLKKVIAIRENAIKTGEDHNVTEAKIAAAKVLVKTKSQDLADQYEKEQVVANRLKETDKLLEEAQKKNAERGREIKASQAVVDQIKAGVAAGTSYKDISLQLLGVEAEALGQDKKRAVELALVNEQKERAAAAVKAGIEIQTKELPLLQQEIALLEQQRKGLISAREEKRQNDINKQTQDLNGDTNLAAQIVDARQHAEELRKIVEDSTVDITGFIKDAFDGLIDGILSGTNKGLDAMKALGQVGKAFLADMFKKILIDKLGFDQTFSANFLKQLPGVVGQGTKSIFGSFQDLFSNVGTDLTEQTSSTGSIGSGLLSVGKSLFQSFTGLFSGSSTGGAASLVSSSGVIGDLGLGATIPLGADDIPLAFAQGDLGGGLGVLSSSTLPSILAGQSIGNATIAAQAAAVDAPISAGASALGSLGTAGIALGVASIISGALTNAAVFKNSTGFFNFDQQDKAAIKSIDGVTKALGEILVPLGDLKSFRSGARDLATGHAATKDAFLTSLNPIGWIEVIMMAFANLPSKGTANRKGIEELFENKDANIPFFNTNSGSFDRSIGQKEARAFATQQPFASGGDPFQEGMQHFVDLQKESLKLSDQQLLQFKGLATAITAFDTKGSKSLTDVDSHIWGGLGAILGNITAKSLDAADAMEVLTKAVAALGPPQVVINELNGSLKAGGLSAQNYKDAVVGLSEVWFKDAPLGVRAGEVAIEELAKTADGAAVDFEKLKERIGDIGNAANIIVPQLKTAVQDAIDASNAGNLTFKVQGQIEDQFFMNVQKSLRDAAISGLTDAFIQASLNAEVLEPFMKSVRETIDAVINKGMSIDDARATIQVSGADAIEKLKQLRPFLQDLIGFGVDINNIFTDVGFNLKNFGEDVDLASLSLEDLQKFAIALATAIAQTEQQQRAFNDRLDLRIADLLGNSDQASNVISGQIDRNAVEFKANLTQFFPSQQDLTDAQTRGDNVEATRIQGVLNGDDRYKPSLEDKGNALTRLEQLTEEDLTLRTKQVELERDAFIKTHQDVIDSLNKEKDQIQRDAENAVAPLEKHVQAIQDIVDARQEELDALNQQIDAMGKFAELSKTIADTLYSIQVDQNSPLAPRGRLSVAQEEFDRQAAIFNDSSQKDDKRIEAAQKLNSLGPQLLQLAQEGGFSQSSEQFRGFYLKVVSTLQQAQELANSKSNGLEDKQQQALDLTAQIKDYQKDIKDTNREIRDIQDEAKDRIKTIDDSIRSETDLITAKQEWANQRIDTLKEHAAGILSWIKDQGNAVFKEKMDRLHARLAELGIDSVNMTDIQYESYYELKRIREILDGTGISVHDDRERPGQFGLSIHNQEALKTTIRDAKDDERNASIKALAEIAQITNMAQTEGFTGTTQSCL